MKKMLYVLVQEYHHRNVCASLENAQWKLQDGETSVNHTKIVLVTGPKSVFAEVYVKKSNGKARKMRIVIQ